MKKEKIIFSWKKVVNVLLIFEGLKIEKNLHYILIFNLFIMSKKLYLSKWRMNVLKTPREFEWYTILAIGYDINWNPLVRAKKWNKQKSFQKCYSYGLSINDIADDDHFNDFITYKRAEKLLIDLKRAFKD